MSRSLDIVTKSRASVEQIYAALGREDYWLARIAAGDGAANTTLESVMIDADSTVTVRTTQCLGELSGLIAKRVPAELRIRNRETWRPVGDRKVRGQVRAWLAGGLGSSRVEAWLAPADRGSQFRYTGSVEIKIPVLGGTLEKSIQIGMAKNIPAVQRFTDKWIADHS
jgi:Protein of unknown function (DUF2505)